jgi:hypothetical protein
MMRMLIAVVATLGLSLLVAEARAHAAAPNHDFFQYPYGFVDTDTCGFPVVGDYVFTNDLIDGTVTTGNGTLQLHQRNVGTLTAKGVTLREDDHYTIFVTFVSGVPVTARHVGDLDEIIGPNGPLFHRTGLDEYAVVYDPSIGFYVDGPRILRHGLRDDFDAAEICAAFG